MSSVSGDYAVGSLTVFGGTSGVTVGGSGLFTGSAGMRISNTGGSISAPAGVGLSVTNATIGAAGMNFSSISATGAANGIVLNNTGTSGGLTVTGTGSADNGGTDFKFRNGSTMTGAGNAANEYGIFITDLFGANNQVSNSSVVGSAAINLFVVNNASTPGTLAISNSTLNATAAPFGGDSVSITTNNSANLTVNATGGNNFNNNQGDGIQLAANISNNNISGLQASGILAQARAGTGNLNMSVSANVVNLTGGFPLDAINIESGSSGGGTNTICLNMFNNNASATGQQGYRLRQRTGTTFNLQNFAGSGASAADVTTWVNTTKSNVGSTDIVIGTAFTNAPAICATP